MEKGRTVFRTVAGIGCKSCHGDFAEGDLGVGPYIRGATEGMIRAAIEGIGEMIAVKMMIKEEEITAVASYLDYLGTLQVARTLSKRGRFLPATIEVRPGTQLQIVIKNSGIKPATYDSDNMNFEPVVISGRSTTGIEWQVPEAAGEYSIHCTDCKLKGQTYSISVHADAPPPAGTPIALSAAPASDGM